MLCFIALYIFISNKKIISSIFRSPGLLLTLRILETQDLMAQQLSIDFFRKLNPLTQKNLLALLDFLGSHLFALSGQSLHEFVATESGSPSLGAS